MEKKELNVCVNTSTKISNTNVLFAILGWISLLVGIVSLLMSFVDYDGVSLIVGCACITSALFCFVFARLFLALHTIVVVNETQHAINKENYSIKSFTTED